MKRSKLLMSGKKRLPTILNVVGVVSGAAALYFTGRATVKAVRKYDALKAEGVEITPKVVIKYLVPYYIPAIGFAGTSFACNIASNTIHVKRNKALSLAATSAAETLREFRSKAKEVIGEEKVKEIEVEQAKDAKAIITNCVGDSPIRVYDISTGVKIETSYKKLYEAEAYVNAHLSESGWTKGVVALKDFYRYLGIEEKHLENLSCAEMLWEQYYLLAKWESNWITFIHEEMFDKDGTPLVMLRYSPAPEYEFIIEEEMGD